jgi:hypothetical protein
VSQRFGVLSKPTPAHVDDSSAATDKGMRECEITVERDNCNHRRAALVVA